MEALYCFIENPVVNIFIAAILVAASLAEGWGTFWDDLSKFKVGVHHGVLIFGFVMLLRGIFEALEAVKRAQERRIILEGSVDC